MGTRAKGGAPKFEESQVLPDVSYADFARGIGLAGITVRHPDQLAPAWAQAFAAAGPTVIDVYCDPEVPPIPPHATLDEAVSTVEAVLGGDPSAVHLAVQGAKEKLQEFLPGRRGDG